MAVAIADKAHILGTTDDLIDSSAAIAAGLTFVTGDTLTISGLTEYDTIGIKTGSGASQVRLVTATNTIQYSSDTGSTWSDIGTWDGGDGRTLGITFLSTQISVTTAIVETLLQSLTIKADTSGTVADARTLTYTFGGTYTESDTSAYSLVGSASADTIIYSTGAIAFDPLAGDDVLLVKTGMGALTLDMKTASQLEKFEVLNATDANSAINLTLGSTIKTVTLGSAADTITIATAADMGTVSVNGGAGRDILNVTAAVTLGDTDLSKLTSVEILTLSNNANSVTLGASNSIDTINGGTDIDTIDASARTVNTAASGFYDLVINAGAGADIVKLSGGNDKILLGDGDDTLTVTSTNLDSDDYVDGGAGTGDKIILNGVSITDTAFTNVSNVEVLEGIATTTTVTLGDKAKAAGITKIDLATTAATGAATVDLSSMTTDAAFTILAGSGGTTVKMTAANLAAGNDTITGHATATADFDTLEITTAGTAAIAATITQIETLKLSSVTGDSSVTLNASNDFTKVDATAATGNITVNASAETTALIINTGSGADVITAGNGDTTIASGDGNDTITAGTGTNTIGTGTGDDTVNLLAGTDTVTLGAGTDTVKVAYDDFTSADTVTGTGDVTLEFTDAVVDGTATVESKMAGAANAIDIIKLGADAAQTVTLGANAKLSGITQIDGTAIVTNTNALTADLTAFATTGVTVKGGTGDDVVKMIAADFGTTTSIQGGTNTAVGDTLEITDEATLAGDEIVDADFTNSTGLEILKLSATDAANTVTIGDNARAAGLKTIDASLNTTTTKAQTVIVNMTNDSNLTIKTAAGADTIKMKGSHLTLGDTIDGGSATDTIEFTDIINVIDTAFTNVTNVEKIKLAAGDGQKLTLGTEAKQAGILEVDASSAGSVTIDASGMSVLPLKITTAAGADIITLGSGVATVATAAGNDTVKINTANLTSADTIDGGADTDTLVIMDAAALVDSNFTKVSNFEALKLSDYNNQTISLGSAAEAKEIKNIDASALSGANTVSVTLDSSYEGQTVKVAGGAGADILKVTNGVISSTMTFIGGSGIDTLELTNAADIIDGDLVNVQEVETIKLADDSTAQTITLGTNASSAGINKVDGSAMLANGSVTIIASDMTNNMDITTVGGNDTITSGHGNDTISTGAGDDVIKIASEYFNSSDSIDGGANTTTGKDILEITSTNAAIADAAFTQVSNIELLRLSENSEYNLTLSTQAALKDIKNIEVTGTGGAKIDASGIGEAVTIKGGTGVETVTLGATDDTLDLGGGNDVIKLAAASLTSADSIDLGSGTDTIEITTATSGELVDDDFTGVRNVETLKLTIDDSQNVVLGDKALNAGIRTVDATAMKTAAKTLTVDMSTMTSNVGMSVTGGYGNDTIKMKAGHLTSADTVTGDLGSDTLEFSGAVTLIDSDFTNVTGVETIKLSDADNQTVTLGEEARNGGQGITTVNASVLSGSNKVTVDLSGMTTDQNMSVTTGAGEDTIKTKAAHLSANDVLDGNGGTDTLEFIDQVNLGSAVFAGVSDIETIKLSDATASNAQTLTLANSAVLNTVDASTITGVVTIDGSAFTNALTITTGTGADIITVGSGANAVTVGDGNDKVIITSAALADGNADTLSGGNGSDILEVTEDTAVGDAQLAAITGFETIALTGAGDKSIAVGTNAKAGGVTTVDASTTSGANLINANAFDGTITLKGGSGVDTITAGTGGNTIQSGAGDDIITIQANTLDLNDTISGGDGNDTLILTGIANLADANFTNVTGIEKLVLADQTGQVLVLGAEAKQAGIVTIDTSAVATTKTVSLDISGMTSTNVTVTGGAGNETIKMASADLTTSDTLTVGTGTDILELTTASELLAADMASISGFEKLKLANVDATQSLTLADGKFSEIDGSSITYAQAVTIDAAAQEGALSITTKGGADVITLGKGANTLDSGSGDDIIRITAATFDSSDALNTGNGSDTLEISGTAVVTDGMFDNVSGLETVKLTTDAAGQSVTLTSTHAGAAGINKVDTTSVTSAVSVDVSNMGTGVTVSTGSGTDTITMGQGIDTINAGAGNDTIKVASAYLTSADVISGGADTNTLHITDKAVVSDDMVTGVTNIDTLKLSDHADAQSVTLGSNAKTNNLLKVDSSAIITAHAVTLDLSGLSAKDIAVTGGAGNETIKMASADLTAADTIALGTGTDILEFTDAVNMTNTALQSGLSGIDKITLGDFATTLTLKDGIGTSLEVNAQAATGVKAATIDISALGTLTTTATVKTSGGDDTITLGGSTNIVNAGAGNDTINISNANVTTGSPATIDGGSGTDKLRVTTAGTLTDDVLAGMTNVEELVIAANADQSVTIGANFANNLFATVDASGLTTGKLTLDATAAVKTGNVDINLTVKGGGAADTIIVNSTKLTATDTIDGNGGNDTLSIKNGAGSTIVDSAFTLVSEIETLKYEESYNHSLIIGDLGKAAGITTVDATLLTESSKLTMDISSMGSDANMTVKTGTGDDEITMKATHLSASDLLQFGNGNNTLKLSGADTLIDNDFNVANSGIHKILFTQDEAQNIAVGAKMVTAGLGTIDATALTSSIATVDISAITASFILNTGGGADIITLGNSAITLNSALGDDTIKMNGTYLTSADSINGGAGTDTLEITTADTLTDGDFTGVSLIETLKLSQDAAQSVILGTEGTAAGIVTINAAAVVTSANAVTIDIQGMTSDKTMSITTGAGNDTIKTKGTDLTSADTIDGGAGTDTLEITTADTLTDGDFTGVSLIETLKLSQDAAQSVI
ncbi:calcium-binding protein, partial [Sulfuricurvum sp.]|uniref:calcium-binding protein n=1 Tax=Sulfuricurvum sp. TaxID=2025608 RepID=UPI00261BF358